MSFTLKTNYNQIVSSIIVLVIGLFIAIITFWLTFYVSCYVSPPFVVIDNERHSVMPIAQTILSILTAIILGISTIIFVFRKVKRKREYSN